MMRFIILVVSFLEAFTWSSSGSGNIERVILYYVRGHLRYKIEFLNPYLFIILFFVGILESNSRNKFREWLKRFDILYDKMLRRSFRAIGSLIILYATYISYNLVERLAIPDENFSGYPGGLKEISSQILLVMVLLFLNKYIFLNLPSFSSKKLSIENREQKEEDENEGVRSDL